MEGRFKLVSAVDMNSKNPKTFHLPSVEKINGIKAGSSVEVCLETSGGTRDRLWVEVDKTDGHNLVGRFSTERSDIPDVKNGKKIEFTIENVYQVYDVGYIIDMYDNNVVTIEQAIVLMKKFYPDKTDDELKEAFIAVMGN